MKTFDRTYRDNLNRLGQIDLLHRSEALNLQIKSGKILIPFFGRMKYITKQGVVDLNGTAETPAVATVVLNYVLRNETTYLRTLEKMSFRDLKDAGPLVTNFANNTNHLIEQTFSGRLRQLEKACGNLGGESVVAPMAADLYMKFEALPEIQLYLSFNDRDEDFPAQSNLLFTRSAEHYLDSKSLFVLGTFLAGSLIGFPTE